MKTERVPLASVAVIDRQAATDAECQTLPYVGLEHIEKDRGEFAPDYRPSPEPRLALKYRFTSDHLLYGKLRPYLNKVALPTFDGVCTTEILPIRVDPAALDKGFLFAVLMSPAFVAWASHMVAGANLPRLSPAMLAEYELPLPPLDEQHRIGGLLSESRRLRRMTEYALELKASALAPSFVRLVCDDTAHPLVSVAELAVDRKGAIRTGPFGSQLLHSEFTDHGIAVLGIDNAVNNRFEWGDRRFITPGKFDKLKRYQVFPGDVLITIMATCGRCAVVPDDIGHAINTKHLCCISLDQTRCLPEYLQGAFLFHPFVREQLEIATRGSIMDGLNMEIIKELRIPVPTIEVQKQYVLAGASYDRLFEVGREAVREATHFFDTILHETVAGAA